MSKRIETILFGCRSRQKHGKEKREKHFTIHRGLNQRFPIIRVTEGRRVQSKRHLQLRDQGVGGAGLRLLPLNNLPQE